MRAASATVASWPVVALLGAGLAAGGCDWREFDNLKADTPVLRLGAPAGFVAPDDFGGVILPTAPPADGSAAARFLGASITSTGLAIVTLDAAGHATSQALTNPALDALAGSPLTAMAEVPGAGEALLGAPSLVGGSLITLNLSTLVMTPVVSSAEPQFGVGVAAGSLVGLADKDFVVTSGSTLHAYLGNASTDLSIADSPACPLALSTSLPSRERINRAVVIGALMATGVEIAVGTPVVSGGGSVSLFTVDATGTRLTCALLLTAPATTDARFGQALAIGDFDGDGISDLLVGAPPNRTYLYRGPITAGAAPAATITDSASGGDFGAALAALDLDGKPGDEALVSDANATVGGKVDAGNVLIYSGPLLATQLTTVLADHAPGTGEAYGSSVGALPFCATAPCTGKLPRLPLVGATSAVFTYFTLGATDPRGK
jgi:hypothetical protein